MTLLAFVPSGNSTWITYRREASLASVRGLIQAADWTVGPLLCWHGWSPAHRCGTASAAEAYCLPKLGSWPFAFAGVCTFEKVLLFLQLIKLPVHVCDDGCMLERTSRVSLGERERWYWTWTPKELCKTVKQKAPQTLIFLSVLHVYLHNMHVHTHLWAHTWFQLTFAPFCKKRSLQRRASKSTLQSNNTTSIWWWKAPAPCYCFVWNFPSPVLSFAFCNHILQPDVKFTSCRERRMPLRCTHSLWALCPQLALI